MCLTTQNETRNQILIIPHPFLVRSMKLSVLALKMKPNQANICCWCCPIYDYYIHAQSVACYEYHVDCEVWFVLVL